MPNYVARPVISEADSSDKRSVLESSVSDGAKFLFLGLLMALVSQAANSSRFNQYFIHISRHLDEAFLSVDNKHISIP